MDPLQQLIGIKATHLLAGLAGGTVRALLMGGGWWAATTSVMIGSLTAGYMTAPAFAAATAYFGIPPETSTEHAVGFLVGLMAMLLCEGILRMARTWAKNPTLPPRP